MVIEHIGYTVENPAEVAAWYVANLGFIVRRKQDAQPWMHFLADSDGRMMIEIYNNPLSAVPDYPAMHPLRLHLALRSDDPEADRDRLVAAGATVVTAMEVTPLGDRLVMLRDPWGFPLQLAKRAVPMG